MGKDHRRPYRKTWNEFVLWDRKTFIEYIESDGDTVTL